jgi:PBP1b-binding outer membrane lipoprotein LpoB
MHKILSTLLVALVMTGCAGSAQVNKLDKNGTDVDIANVKTLAKENRIKGYECKQYTQTGTHLKKTVCNTQEDIDKAEQVSRALRDDMRRSGTLCVKNNGCKDTGS